MCENCGITTDNPRFCSRSCSAIVTNRESPKRHWHCQRCGGTGAPASYGSRLHVECQITPGPVRVLTDAQRADHQRRLWRIWYSRNASKKMDWVAAREAKKLGLWVENVDRSVVFARDGGICQLQISPECPVQLDRNWWHLDHRVPIAADGPHSYANTQASCPPCNWMKADKLIRAAVVLNSSMGAFQA